MSALFRRTVLRLHRLATGRHILDRMEELNRTQWLRRDELLPLQRDKLQRLIEYAYQHIPYYRRTFDQAGFHPEDLRRDMARFRNLPVLTKAIIHENFQELQTTEPQRRMQLSKVTTSGSTGHPLVFMQDNNCRDCVTADIQRHLGWAGWKMGKLHAYIWGAHFEATTGKSLRRQLIDWVWNRFLTNAYRLTDASLAVFTEHIRRRHPCVLFGYPSSLYRLAQFVRESPHRGIIFDGIISSAEVLLPVVRQSIEETFRCKVFDRYAAMELGGVACECPSHTGLHVSVENNFVEILCDGRPVEPGETGSITITNLNNWGMPFIRYSIGDEGAWHDGGDCPCGRTAPMLMRIEGRVVDRFKTRDGSTSWAGFTGAGYRCLADPSIRQFQIIQKSLDRMVVRLVKDGEISQSSLDELVRTIHTAFGDTVTVDFEFPDEIPVPPSGKHRYAISELK